MERRLRRANKRFRELKSDFQKKSTYSQSAEKTLDYTHEKTKLHDFLEAELGKSQSRVFWMTTTSIPSEKNRNALQNRMKLWGDVLEMYGPVLAIDGWERNAVFFSDL